MTRLRLFGYRSLSTTMLVTASVAMVATGLAGPVSAAPAVTLVGGDGIVVTGANRADELCTLNSIGRDRSGALVGLTAGHCAHAGDSISPEGGARPVGTVVFSVQSGGAGSVDGVDYAVIRFDPARVRPSAGSGARVIVGVGADPAPGVVACKQGRTTGFGCGPVRPRVSSSTLVVATCSQPGDSGAPVIVGNRVVGLIRGSIVYSSGGGYPACASAADADRVPTAATSMTAVIADLNGRGITGAGYRPI